MNYPEYKGTFAALIAHNVVRAEQLIDDFGNPAKRPQLAISVDMLDTGIDVPEVVNLVFFKPVRSKTKYWQMIGRGTRLSPELYGPGLDKRDFVVFDVCGNIEFFNQEDMHVAEPVVSRPLGHRVFAARTGVLAALNARVGVGLTGAGLSSDEEALRSGLAATLCGFVTGMNTANFLVRRRLEFVDRFSTAAAWLNATTTELQDAADELGGLPSAATVAGGDTGNDSDELAKRFGLLVLRAEIGALTDGVEASVRERIQGVVDRIADQRTIPAVQAQLVLIDAVLTPEWWDAVSATSLESMRIRLRGLVRLIDRPAQATVYTDFEDELVDMENPGITIASPGVDHERFRAKLLSFLAGHQNDLVLQKLRTGRQLTAVDLDTLERMRLETGDFSEPELRAEAERAHGLGLLIRSLAGLDRASASEVFSSFVAARNLNAKQIGFVDLVVSQLSDRGYIDPGILFTDSPFTDASPAGAADLFPGADVEELAAAVDAVRASAVVS
ncbi:MAG TPA: type I restriction-modification enzyme R subunit C-terminal domain-containing protein [Microbacteriaceae bacterium]